jgi:hypothetical protein
MWFFVAAPEADADVLPFDTGPPAFMIDIAALDTDGLALHKGLGNLPSGRLYDTPEGLAGDLHLFGGIHLVKAEKVCKPHGFNLIDGEHDVLEPGWRYAFRQEAGHFRKAFDGTAVHRSADTMVFHRNTSGNVFSNRNETRREIQAARSQTVARHGKQSNIINC